jgi:hypothetical protein
LLVFYVKNRDNREKRQKVKKEEKIKKEKESERKSKKLKIDSIIVACKQVNYSFMGDCVQLTASR